MNLKVIYFENWESAMFVKCLFRSGRELIALHASIHFIPSAAPLRYYCYHSFTDAEIEF